MKIKILFLLLFISAINFGQSSIKYFIKGGLSSSNTVFHVIKNGSSSIREFDNRNSFYVGTGFEILLSSKQNDLLFQVELVYSEQGWVIHYTYSGYVIHELNQINLPIIIKKRIFKNLFAITGGYLGHVIHSKEKSYDNPNRFEIEGYKNFDAGLVLGLEYKFKFGGFLETKYMHGLADVSKVSYPSSFIEHEYKNRIIQIGIGFQF
ncbi:hypothetical protein BTO04_14705 [Polaribacter sp. SA4-10]|uniref:outer membrane beta-barrel protein n=1 Tax=Polaribacter sp. SA4-10 TaxID=754397 RepID=UPI000B3C67C5|nr:outer membrane beta-barrel protein [Polaribacter sp. SA4-10]ARV07867.1 hypothetical protein BTO04_14705 [Polaribacter sp. SA4-10]